MQGPQCRIHSPRLNAPAGFEAALSMTTSMTTDPTQQPEGQPVSGSPGGAGLFIVLGIVPTEAAAAAVREWCGTVGGLARSLLHRYPHSELRCVVGFGSDAWDRVFGRPRPAKLHTFEALHAGNRHAPSTPGDIVIHLRSERVDLAFDLASRLVAGLGDAVVPIDEVHGFRSFDARSILGFVDGTENPVGDAADLAVFVGGEDPEFTGGSYVLVQKYLHDMAAWKALSIPEQERVFGRTKIDDVEMDDAVKPTNSHIALNVITDENGEELKIVRANLPFGQPSRGEFGTYFIGYARDPAITLRMLTNMFIGDPPGNYDRLLDFSTAVTGTLFFVPSADLLEALADRDPAAPDAAGADDDDDSAGDGADEGDEARASASLPGRSPAEADTAGAGNQAGGLRRADGSLAIGSLKGEAGGTMLPTSPGRPL